ncbi:invasion associated locus B family protein [Azorhizobium caulinodans]|uniref:invasion associated locus B family protein n=3 Tax=Azorhizobium caulinodans TaxID=7 RepID=UPI00068F27EB|nr:invasion protein IalB [Azorhizobium sp. AG788]
MLFLSFLSRRPLGLLAGAAAGALIVASGALAQTAQTAPKPAAPKPAAAAPAAAPAKGPELGEDGPSRTTATYDDWVVRCERSEVVGGAKVCEAAQTLQIGNAQQQLGAQVVFGRLTKEAPMRIVVQLPVGVWLPNGARFVLPGDKPRTIAMPYKFCIRACIADADLSADDVAALNTNAGPAKLEFLDRNQQPVALEISFKGLPAALAARDKG